MKAHLFALTLSACGCLADERPNQEQGPLNESIQLRTDSEWNTDCAITIKADDTVTSVTVLKKTGKVSENLTWKVGGVYARLMRRFDSLGAWEFTSKALMDDFKRAGAYSKGTVGDVGSTTLAARSGDRYFTASFYGAMAYSEIYPDAKQVAAYASLEREIFKLLTDKTRQQVAPSDGDKPSN